MKKVFSYPKYLKKNYFHYCPGCGHSVIHRLLAEVLEELDMGGKTISVAPAGCAVLAYFYFDFDTVEAAHGRGAAVATGVKRAMPDRLVFSYQGDGDLTAIGTAEAIHAAARGERITVIFINNANYGMTGGQMAPTTLLDQKTTTSPRGRNPRTEGYPLHLSEMVSIMPGVSYIERVALTNPKNILKAKKAIKNAFVSQLNDEGFSMIEILSACPTNWKKSTEESMKWIDDVLAMEFKPGVVVDRRINKDGLNKPAVKEAVNAD